MLLSSSHSGTSGLYVWGFNCLGISVRSCACVSVCVCVFVFLLSTEQGVTTEEDRWKRETGSLTNQKFKKKNREQIRVGVRVRVYVYVCVSHRFVCQLISCHVRGDWTMKSKTMSRRKYNGGFYMKQKTKNMGEGNFVLAFRLTALHHPRIQGGRRRETLSNL